MILAGIGAALMALLAIVFEWQRSTVPQRPSVAVLPFENLSADPGQDYFADGITEDLITGLQSFQSFPIIARTSTFQYKGKSPDIREVAKALGAACTPDFFLYDRARRLVYRGQFDGSRPGNDVPVTGTDLRTAADTLETLVADDLWPLPTYREMLFIK